jgi:hypothetical protein
MNGTQGSDPVQIDLSHHKLRSKRVEQQSGQTLQRPLVDIERGLDAIIESLNQQVPGSSSVRAAAQVPLVVLVWLKAFIHRDVPGYTQLAPNWGSATMLNDPWIPGCWLTDNRDFWNDAYASARMTSMLAVTVPTLAVNQLHFCDLTIKLDCGNGDVDSHAYGDASRMTFINPRGMPNVAFQIDLVGAGSNPCPPLGFSAPDIDYNGTIAIDFRARQVLFQGNLDQFPFFEMYAMEYISGAPLKGVTMFNTPPLPGGGPGGLFGGANRPQVGFAQI